LCLPTNFLIIEWGGIIQSSRTCGPVLLICVLRKRKTKVMSARLVIIIPSNLLSIQSVSPQTQRSLPLHTMYCAPHRRFKFVLVFKSSIMWGYSDVNFFPKVSHHRGLFCNREMSCPQTPLSLFYYSLSKLGTALFYNLPKLFPCSTTEAVCRLLWCVWTNKEIEPQLLRCTLRRSLVSVGEWRYSWRCCNNTTAAHSLQAIYVYITQLKRTTTNQ
jgi:hypothetical protein